MKILKDLIQRSNPTIDALKIPSKSQKGEYHKVSLHRDGTITCDCEAWQYKKECSHIKKAKEIWEDEHGWMWRL